MRFLIVPLLLSATVCGQSNSQNPAVPKSNESKPLTGLPAEVLNAELISAHGRTFRLSNYKGKVLVLNLFATWVGPSKLETPFLVKLQRKFRTKGISVVQLSVENPKSSQKEVNEWIRKYGIAYKTGWAPPDTAIALMQGRDAIPQTFVVAASGHIIRRFIGFNPAESPPMWETAVTEALVEGHSLVIRKQ